MKLETFAMLGLLCLAITACSTCPKVDINSTQADVDTAYKTVDPPNYLQLGYFLISKQCIKCDLTGVVLKGKDLRGADLENANLGAATLDGTDLREANLTRVVFWSYEEDCPSKRHHASLFRTNLSRASLVDASLRRAFLQEANLQGADLSRAKLNDADLSGANLSGAKLYWANLIGTDLSKAKLDGADLSAVQYDERTRFPKGYKP